MRTTPWSWPPAESDVRPSSPRRDRRHPDRAAGRVFVPRGQRRVRVRRTCVRPHSSINLKPKSTPS